MEEVRKQARIAVISDDEGEDDDQLSDPALEEAEVDEQLLAEYPDNTEVREIA